MCVSIVFIMQVLLCEAHYEALAVANASGEAPERFFRKPWFAQKLTG
jgi:hypothetical protein